MAARKTRGVVAKSSRTHRVARTRWCVSRVTHRGDNGPGRVPSAEGRVHQAQGRSSGAAARKNAGVQPSLYKAPWSTRARACVYRVCDLSEGTPPPPGRASGAMPGRRRGDGEPSAGGAPRRVLR